MKPWIRELAHTHFGPGKYSQSYQDVLLERIFEHLGTHNAVPFCVEFGFNTPDLVGGSGANVARLIRDKGWNALLLDGSNENAEINLHKHFLTPSNICDLFRKYNVPKEPEYISIDVDSTDLWLFEAVVKQYRAMVFSVEYNPHYPLHSAITFPNDPNEHWQEDRGYGASLKALTLVAQAHGYSLVWVVPCLDAIFIRNDLIDDGTDELCFPFDTWKTCTSLFCHRSLKDRTRVGIFMDYEVYLATNGDVEASRSAALPVCRSVLLDSIYQRILRKAQRVAKKFIRTTR